jgi:dipeptidase E
VSRRRTIVALGGRGFTHLGQASAIDRYVLSLARATTPKICFIPTASNDPAAKVRRFYRAFRNLDCVPSHLDLFRQTIVDVAAYLREQDVVYVGGGNTRNLLALWKLWGVDCALKAAYANGTVLAGVSAGALCWFREGVTDSFPGRLEPLRCLGLIDASFAPHYDGEAERRPAFQALIARGRLRSGYAADDGVALRFEGGAFREAVSDVPGASAYRVVRAVRGARERALPTRLLE